MGAFQEHIAEAVKKQMFSPEFGAKITGRVFFAVSSTDADYIHFVDKHPSYDDGVPAVYTTVQGAIDACIDGDTVYVKAKDMAGTATDPVDWAETLTIAAGQSGVSLIGISSGQAQGRLPQIKKGSGSTALLTLRAAGCLIKNIGFNGAGSTGGGILLDDDGGTSKNAFGTVIEDCHFKNCKGHATNGTLGGAIAWSSAGGAWQVLIRTNTFYKNVTDICLIGTTGSVPQDVIIRDNVFSGPATSVDVNIYLAGGSGMSSVTIVNNVFPSVLPALTSGSVGRYVDLTGCTGIFANNFFGGAYTTTGFGAAKAAAKIPTTVGMPHNYSDSGLIVREA